MTPDELFKKANTEMTRRYESGIRCMEDAKNMQSVKFFRDFSQGEIDGIADFSLSMYMTIIYNFNNEEEAGEDRTYNNYAIKIRTRARNLKDLLSEYATRFLVKKF